ncbi:MAG: hypothetical protein H7330_01480 [Hymenobacteraceae bacterium]|nr:hypothetical protein [Hymenobacteraceae bacterium]
MRVFALLFACYLTLLSCLPCTDEVERVVTAVATTLTAGPTAEHHERAPDWCSPLCQCHCCAGVVVPMNLAADFPEAVVPAWADRHFAELVSAAPTRTGTGAWQPPRA